MQTPLQLEDEYTLHCQVDINLSSRPGAMEMIHAMLNRLHRAWLWEVCKTGSSPLSIDVFGGILP
jgi:hypothetical protein